MTGKQIEAGAKAHQYVPENVRKENRITGYRCRNFPGESLRKYFFLIAAERYLTIWENFS